MFEKKNTSQPQYTQYSTNHLKVNQAFRNFSTTNGSIVLQQSFMFHEIRYFLDLYVTWSCLVSDAQTCFVTTHNIYFFKFTVLSKRNWRDSKIIRCKTKRTTVKSWPLFYLFFDDGEKQDLTGNVQPNTCALKHIMYIVMLGVTECEILCSSQIWQKKN